MFDAFDGDAMTRFSCAVRMLLMSWLIQFPCAAPAAVAGGNGPLRCAVAPGSSRAELRGHLDELRLRDSFYRRLIAWKGPPAACKGRFGKGPTQGESRLEFSWSDGSTFERSFMLPEIFVVRYGRPRGLTHADELIAAWRDYADGRGLRVDWTSPHPESEGGKRIVEYRDPDSGVNGIVRFTYDRQDRLVAVSLSTAP
jgi:hypothetical protein